ncbi:hypothetical protein [Mesorhizobium sp. B2-3-2]|jgi:hypothetical protein|uniref:hypothetical protein n=1 Tax=Mesorhizobium sp. B2-3-2 TaxID=2589961 RepID=UPI001128DD66|nr:hypothetical protein [Mesorhizobium sp. B2-3-2]TPM45842.1 hypothetical protein FJ964_14925 [Mesorhizobium sp. B2-3-2]
MKTASRLLQILALSACFAAQAHGAFSMPGVRQALRIMAGPSGQILSSIDASLDLMREDA